MNDIHIRPATVEDLDRLASLHEHYIEDSRLAQLGARFLKFIHAGIVRSRYGISYICENRGETIGFVCGAVDSERAFCEILSCAWLPMLRTAAGRVFKNPGLLRILPDTFRYFKVSDIPGVHAELLFAAVEPPHRGRGIAGKTLDAVLASIQSAGCTSVKVTVSAGNVPVQRHLQLRGFKPVKTVTVYGIRRTILVRRDVA